MRLFVQKRNNRKIRIIINLYGQGAVESCCRITVANVWISFRTVERLLYKSTL